MHPNKPAPTADQQEALAPDTELLLMILGAAKAALKGKAQDTQCLQDTASCNLLWTRSFLQVSPVESSHEIQSINLGCKNQL